MSESERQEFYESAVDAAKQGGLGQTGGGTSGEDEAAGQAGADQIQRNVDSAVEPGSEEPGVGDVMSSEGMKDPDAPIK